MSEHLKDRIAITDRVLVLETRLGLFAHTSKPVIIGGGLPIVRLLSLTAVLAERSIIPAREVNIRCCLY